MECSRSEKEVMAGVVVESKTGDGLGEALVRTFILFPVRPWGSGNSEHSSDPL